MIWFLLFLAVLGIAWFLFVPRTGETQTQDKDQPDAGNLTVVGDYRVGAHATDTVPPSLTHPAELFTADGTGDIPTAGQNAAEPGGTEQHREPGYSAPGRTEGPGWLPENFEAGGQDYEQPGIFE